MESYIYVRASTVLFYMKNFEHLWFWEVYKMVLRSQNQPLGVLRNCVSVCTTGSLQKPTLYIRIAAGRVCVYVSQGIRDFQNAHCVSQECYSLRVTL